MKITILVDNKAGGNLKAEHGFSLWIETDDTRILFDTGQGAALPANVESLGIDLSFTDHLIVSHGHFDHTGGIPYALGRAPKASLSCHPGVLAARYSVHDGRSRAIHIPSDAAKAITALPPERVHWVSEPRFLTERIGLTGPIPREAAYEDTGGPFYLDPEGKRPDPIEDDIALWVRGEDGLVVFVGCAHAGVVNSVGYVRRLNGGIPVRAVIGGFHLGSAARARIEATIAAFRLLETTSIIPCHCTGDDASRALREALGERVVAGRAGMVLEL